MAPHPTRRLQHHDSSHPPIFHSNTRRAISNVMSRRRDTRPSWASAYRHHRPIRKMSVYTFDSWKSRSSRKASKAFILPVILEFERLLHMLPSRLTHLLQLGTFPGKSPWTSSGKQPCCCRMSIQDTARLTTLHQTCSLRRRHLHR